MDIDFKLIKEKYSKSYDKWIKYIGIRFCNICYCDLEKFFDNNGIIIIIDNDTTYRGDIGKVKLYSWIYRIIVLEQKRNNEIRNWYENKSRQEVKEQAIIKSFEILENKLVKQNKK